jgi:putative transposase
VDAGGLVLAAHVHAASLHDRDGALRLLLSDQLRRELPRMGLLWAHGAYTRNFRESAEEERGWRVKALHHPDRQFWRYGLGERPCGFLVLPRRWVAQRTFAWQLQTRWLTKDYERLPEMGVAMICWAMSRIMLCAGSPERSAEMHREGPERGLKTLCKTVSMCWLVNRPLETAGLH